MTSLRSFPLASTAATAGAVTAMVAMALWPPRTGAMMLVPVGGDLAGTVNAARSAGATLLAAGPLTGSVIVRGDRGRLMHEAGRVGTAVFAAPAATCGSPS